MKNNKTWYGTDFDEAWMQKTKQIAAASHILFDLDGTLTDPKEGITRCVQYALKKFGIDEPDLDKLLCFIGPPLVDSFMEYYGFSREKAEQAVVYYRERFRDIGIFENRVLDGADQMLRTLKEKKKVLCLATSKPGIFAERILEKYDLRKYFDVVVGSELDGRRGKKAEVIEEVLARCGLTERRKQAVMVGDRHHDIDGAKACGLLSIGVTFGYAEPGELEQAGSDQIAGSMAELTELFVR